MRPRSRTRSSACRSARRSPSRSRPLRSTPGSACRPRSPSRSRSTDQRAPRERVWRPIAGRRTACSVRETWSFRGVRVLAVISMVCRHCRHNGNEIRVRIGEHQRGRRQGHPRVAAEVDADSVAEAFWGPETGDCASSTRQENIGPNMEDPCAGPPHAGRAGRGHSSLSATGSRACRAASPRGCLAHSSRSWPACSSACRSGSTGQSTGPRSLPCCPSCR